MDTIVHIATADIGTNTVLLLIAELAGSQITPIYQEQRIARLGQGVDAARKLHPDAITRVADAIRDYADITRHYGIDRLYATATSAARDASNKDDFVRAVGSIAGVQLDILSGEDEALWAFRGALSNRPDITNATVLDIGGGSTELVVGQADRILFRQSLDVGSVRYTERFFPSLPPTEQQVIAFREQLDQAINSYDLETLPNAPFVGTAGTITSLAAVDQALIDYDPTQIDGTTIAYERVVYWADRLLTMPVAHILRLAPGVLQGRADVFPAGVCILEAVMRRFCINELVVSDRGLRFGWALAVSTR